MHRGGRRGAGSVLGAAGAAGVAPECALKGLAAASAVVAALAVSPSLAADVDHRGALGIAFSVGAHLDAPLSGATAEGAGRLDAVVTAALSAHDDHELLLGAGILTTGSVISACAAYRLYFGREEWKTFSDVGGTVHLYRAFALGPRLGLGVQYDPSPLFGFFLAAHAEVAFGGSAPRAGAAAAIGVQGRSFLLQ